MNKLSGITPDWEAHMALAERFIKSAAWAELAEHVENEAHQDEIALILGRILRELEYLCRDVGWLRKEWARKDKK